MNCRDSVPGRKDHSPCRLPGCGRVPRTGIAAWKTSQLQLCPNPANRKENHQISTEPHCPRVRKHHEGDTAPGDKVPAMLCFSIPVFYQVWNKSTHSYQPTPSTSRASSCDSSPSCKHLLCASSVLFSLIQEWCQRDSVFPFLRIVLVGFKAH